jgi:hypothetical protein
MAVIEDIGFDGSHLISEESLVADPTGVPGPDSP